MAGEGAKGIDPNSTEAMFIENTGHPVSSRLALAHASKSHVHALGLTSDDVSGNNNGHYAPFSWRSQVSPMMTLNRRRIGALLLVVAGVYQWTPLKRVCLRQCRSPFDDRAAWVSGTLLIAGGVVMLLT
jgi:hypothetical protein